MPNIFAITRSGSNRHDHSGPGDWLAQTGLHVSEELAVASGQGGVPNSQQDYIKKSDYTLEIKQKWIRFPSSADPQQEVVCNVCQLFRKG